MSEDEPQAIVFDDDGAFPNSRLPVLVYRAAIPAADAEAFERRFRDNGWVPLWRDGVFPYHHYHSTAHEALGVAAGSATLQLGGPNGAEIRIEAGDGLVIPAGVAHRRITASPDFLLVGAYPPGQEDWDIIRGTAADRPAADRRIAELALPPSDPVAGPNGALTRIWA
jgi:uncharacterized protein YjlB